MGVGEERLWKRKSNFEHAGSGAGGDGDFTGGCGAGRGLMANRSEPGVVLFSE